MFRYIASLNVLLLAAAIYPSPLAAIAPEAEARGCASRALRDYAKASVDLFKDGTPDDIMTTEATVALRRLEESLCHKIASCVRDECDNGLALSHDFFHMPQRPGPGEIQEEIASSL
jgi:hypothetical protein